MLCPSCSARRAAAVEQAPRASSPMGSLGTGPSRQSYTGRTRCAASTSPATAPYVSAASPRHSASGWSVPARPAIRPAGSQPYPVSCGATGHGPVHPRAGYTNPPRRPGTDDPPAVVPSIPSQGDETHRLAIHSPSLCLFGEVLADVLLNETRHRQAAHRQAPAGRASPWPAALHPLDAVGADDDQFLVLRHAGGSQARASASEGGNQLRWRGKSPPKSCCAPPSDLLPQTDRRVQLPGPPQGG